VEAEGVLAFKERGRQTHSGCASCGKMKIVSLQLFDWGTTHPGASPPAQSTVIVVFAHVGRCGVQEDRAQSTKIRITFSPNQFSDYLCKKEILEHGNPESLPSERSDPVHIIHTTHRMRSIRTLRKQTNNNQTKNNSSRVTSAEVSR